jgi:hypothetical protein
LVSAALLRATGSALIGAALLATAPCTLSAEQDSESTSTPTYLIAYTTYRDVSTLDQQFNYARVPRARFSVYALTSFSDSKNTTLRRTYGRRSLQIGFNYALPYRVTAGVSATGISVSDREPASSARSLTNSVALNLSFDPVPSVSISRSQGFALDRYQTSGLSQSGPSSSDQRNEGANDATVLSWRPLSWPGLGTPGVPLLVTYDETGQSQRVTASRKRGLTASLDIPIAPVRLQAKGTLVRSHQSYPLQVSRETKRLQEERGSLVLSPAGKTGSLKAKLSVDLSRADSRYSSRDRYLASSVKNNLVEEATFTGDLDYTVRDRLTVGTQLKRTGKRGRYGLSVNDEDLLHHDLRTSLTWRLSTGATLSLRRTLRLSRYDLSHPFNFNTRDVKDDETSGSFSFNLSFRTSLSAILAVRQNHQIYVRREMSANNRKKTSYEFSPALEFRPYDFLVLRESFGLRADYVVYDFYYDRSSLLRTRMMGTRAELRPGGRRLLTIDYGYDSQDQGNYLFDSGTQRWGYDRDSGRDQYVLEMSSPLSVGRQISADFRYRRQHIQRWLFRPDSSLTRIERIPASHLLQQDFSVVVSGRLGARAAISADVARTFREDERGFWNVRTKVSYDF